MFPGSGQPGARRALPLDTHLRDLLVRISERPDPIDIVGARPVEV
jgi:hypothetical protein